MATMTSTKSGFFLEKTYMDYTDPAGNSFILYSASLHYYFLQFNYSGFIFSDENNQITKQKSIHKSHLTNGNGQLSFSNRHFGITGSWSDAGPPISSQLYKNSSGTVYWNCHHPLAICQISFQNRAYSGLGYAETLILSIKPWRLPMDALRWGRFTADGVYVVWIQWTGAYPVNKIFLNGKEFNDAVYSENKIWFNGGRTRIELYKCEIIRQVNLVSHLSKISWLKLLLSATRILNSVETKYKSAADLITSEGVISSGRCIYENVKWEK